MNMDLDQRLQKERVEGRVLKQKKNWFFFDYPNGNFLLKNWSGWLLLLLFIYLIFLEISML